MTETNPIEAIDKENNVDEFVAEFALEDNALTYTPDTANLTAMSKLK